jgi:hypothetical protein
MKKGCNKQGLHYIGFALSGEMRTLYLKENALNIG